MDDYFHTVYADGDRGQIWNTNYVFDRLDDGAFRIKLHSAHDGVLITIALQDRNVHPYQIIIDNDGQSEINHHLTTLARVRGAKFPRSQPAWVWVRFIGGRVWVGFGPTVGQNTIMSGQTRNSLGGGYYRFAVGKTGNSGAFEILDCQPLERRKAGNINLRGAI